MCRRAEASAQRIDEVLVSTPAVQDGVDAQTEFAPQGRVVFEHVSFSYRSLTGATHERVLDDITFVAEPGETVALLGATGSGKSTLVYLIPRFYEVDTGRVTIDGVDVRDLTQTTLRRHVGVALQESVLFSGTVRDNIRYGRPEASDDEVIDRGQAGPGPRLYHDAPRRL